LADTGVCGVGLKNSVMRLVVVCIKRNPLYKVRLSDELLSAYFCARVFSACVAPKFGVCKLVLIDFPSNLISVNTAHSFRKFARCCNIFINRYSTTTACDCETVAKARRKLNSVVTVATQTHAVQSSLNGITPFGVLLAFCY
jgi:hypothetical protein